MTQFRQKGICWIALALLVCSPCLGRDEDKQNVVGSAGRIWSTVSNPMAQCHFLLAKLKRNPEWAVGLLLVSAGAVYFWDDILGESSESGMPLEAMNEEGLHEEVLKQAWKRYELIEKSSFLSLKEKGVEKDDIERQIKVILPVLHRHLFNRTRAVTVGQSLSCQSGDCDVFSVLLAQILTRYHGRDFSKRLRLVLLPDRSHAILKILRPNQTPLYIETTIPGGYIYRTDEKDEFLRQNFLDIKGGRTAEIPFTKKAVRAWNLQVQAEPLIKSWVRSNKERGRSQLQQVDRLINEDTSLQPLRHRNLSVRATMHFMNGEKKEAFRLADQFIKEFPTIGRSHLLKGIFEERENRLVNAKKLYEAAVKANPNFMHGHIVLLRIRLRLEEPEGEIRAEMKRLIERSPVAFDAQVFRERQLETPKSKKIAEIYFSLKRTK